MSPACVVGINEIDARKFVDLQKVVLYRLSICTSGACGSIVPFHSSKEDDTCIYLLLSAQRGMKTNSVGDRGLNSG